MQVAGDMAQLVENLPGICKVLQSVSAQHIKHWVW